MSIDGGTHFSTSGEDVIKRTIDIHPDPTSALSASQLEDFYEIERTAAEILSGDYKRIALQFPDELLHDSVPIFRSLICRIGKGRELYVLADTSYGSCCVDEVAASHANADAVVHYGHACMSLPSRLPVIYVFGKKSLHVERCVSQLVSALNTESPEPNRTILLKHDVAYAHQADQIYDKLKDALESNSTLVLYNPIPLKAEPVSSSITRQSSATSGSSLNANTIFYVGEESQSLTNLLMMNSSCNIYSFDPQTDTARLESVRTNRLLMRRYATVQKARDADVFGILIGTLGVASYLPVIKHLRSLLARKQKKSYTISVGKLNPAKLANFLEIQCFVLVACPENSLIEAKDFLRPIVTPYELDVALQDEPIWSGRYILDFDLLLSLKTEGSNGTGSTDHTSSDALERDQAADEDSDKPVFSLITGTYRHPKRYTNSKSAHHGVVVSPHATSSDSALVLRNQDSTVAKITSDSAAAQFLQERTYRGLEPRLEEDKPSILEQGRGGIARGYQDDFKHQTYQ